MDLGYGLPSTFTYTAFQLGVQEIRLLKVLPELSLEGLVRCQLVHVNFDSVNPPHFEALSYTWASVHPPCQVLVNDYVFDVAGNLGNFLRIARKRCPSWLWIDAICVDQANDGEKANQIKLMHRIFGTAQRVLVWLGSEQMSIYSLFDMARQGSLQARMDAIQQYRKVKTSASALDKNLQASGGFDTYPADQHDVASHIKHLHSHRYWYRMWTLQELLLAQDRVVLCDDLELSWSDCLALMRIGDASGLELPPIMKLILDHCGGTYCPRDSTVYNKVNLMDLVLQCQRACCSIPHDRIYALLALVKDGDQFPVDYKYNMTELSVNTILFSLRHYVPQSSNQQSWFRESAHVNVEGLARILHGKQANSASSARLSVSAGQIAFVCQLYTREWYQLPSPTHAFRNLEHNTLLDSQRRVQRYWKCYTKHFDVSDVLYHNEPLNITLVLRKFGSCYYIVGRCYSGSTIESCQKVYRTSKSLVCEYYGEEGLYGTKFLPSRSKGDAGKASGRMTLGSLVFSDEASAMVLLSLPKYLNICRTAVTLMAKRNRKQRNFESIKLYNSGETEVVDESLNAQDYLISM